MPIIVISNTAAMRYKALTLIWIKVKKAAIYYLYVFSFIYKQLILLSYFFGIRPALFNIFEPAN